MKETDPHWQRASMVSRFVIWWLQETRQNRLDFFVSYDGLLKVVAVASCESQVECEFEMLQLWGDERRRGEATARCEG